MTTDPLTGSQEWSPLHQNSEPSRLPHKTCDLVRVALVSQRSQHETLGISLPRTRNYVRAAGKLREALARTRTKAPQEGAEEIHWSELLDDVEAKGQAVARVLRSKVRHTPDPGQRNEWLQEVKALADRIPPQHLTHPIMRQLERHRIMVGRSASFHNFMVEQSERRKLRIPELGWLLNDKITAYQFIDRLGVRRPAGSLAPSLYREIEWQYPGVLKAASGTGGRGIYLAFSEDEIVHVYDGVRLGSSRELSDHVTSLMDVKKGRSFKDRWIMEELILENKASRTPARDVKFFCFYGEVLFVLEVIRNGKESLYSFTRPDGSKIKPGNWNYKYFESQGASSADLDLATRISRQIPHPFMRIDMLQSENGLVFGEFTPRPGGFQRFNAKWNRLMGEAWVRAEERIQRDLLTGKRFDDFLSATRVYESS